MARDPHSAPWPHRAALGTFFRLARHAPWTLRPIRPLAVAVALAFAPKATRAIRRNLARIQAHESFVPRPNTGETPVAQAALDTPAGNTNASLARRDVSPRETIAAFFDVVADLARLRDATPAHLRSLIASIEGRESYVAARASRTGAVLVTAHLGSFEVGLAALAEIEPAVTVVFKRDPYRAFEQIRAGLRRSLNITEAPVDDGWATLLKLKQTLDADGVVVLQADRAYPGQRSLSVPFFSGRLRMPAGPVTLARFNASPIIPVFTTRHPDGTFAVHLGAPIRVRNDDADDVILGRIARAIECRIAPRPEQWLVLQEAFEEDRPAGEEKPR